jgi:thymidine kinase
MHEHSVVSIGSSVDNEKKTVTGSLSVFTGPMYSGKTSHLIQHLTQHADICYGNNNCGNNGCNTYNSCDSNCSDNGYSSCDNCDGGYRNVLLINSSVDTRDTSRTVSSHSSSYKGVSDKITILSVLTLGEVDVTKYDIVGVDECQFFPDLLETVEKWLKLGKHIYCAGLDSDAKMKKFGQVHDLLHLSDRFVKLTAYCSLCLKEKKYDILTPDNLPTASFTGRVVAHYQSKTQIDVGGADKYQPVCRFHMHQLL